jgi:hypothetical protein
LKTQFSPKSSHDALHGEIQSSPAALRAEFWSAPAETLFDRSTTAAALNRSNPWLEKVATIGGGPPFLKFGRRVLYRKADVLSWLEANSLRAASTSAYPKTPSQKRRETQAA